MHRPGQEWWPQTIRAIFLFTSSQKVLRVGGLGSGLSGWDGLSSPSGEETLELQNSKKNLLEAPGLRFQGYTEV